MDSLLSLSSSAPSRPLDAEALGTSAEEADDDDDDDDEATAVASVGATANVASALELFLLLAFTADFKIDARVGDR